MLNAEQTQALDLLNDSKNRSVVLKGYAGTGKTFTIVEWLKSSGRKVLLTAPTNKATAVLEQMCARTGLKAKCATTHSALALNLIWNEGKQILKPKKKGSPIFESYPTVVVDECSMLNEEMMGFIESSQNRKRNRVIYMGDPAQLPPINEDFSASFEAGPEVELRKIMRQPEDSAIPYLGEKIRTHLEHRLPLYESHLTLFEDGETIEVWDKEKDWERVLDCFESGEEARYLAYKNRVVQDAIRGIRKRLYGENAPELMAGEMVQCIKPLKNPVTDEICHYTDALVQISDIRPETQDGLLAWRFRVDEHWYTTVQSEHIPLYKQREKEIKQKCLNKEEYWDVYHDFVDSWSWVRPAQAMTIHKSQGSTFEKVFVDVPDVMSQWDRALRKKLMYVACSRPSSKLILLTKGT